ncbi:MAG: leucine-rich repeat protein [Oscillospiraceae bacterium]|nr:leucine-rich repeat protein [Oscillospiraceae bacterium]
MKLKRFCAVLSALCMVCTAVPVLPELVQSTPVISASAEEEYTYETYEIWSYKKYADHIEIYSAEDKENITEANIPAEIEGLPVKYIRSFAFTSCPNLTSVTLPDSLTTIEQSAFKDCLTLTSVTLPDGLTTIGGLAFFSSGLTSVTIPESVTSIEHNAFRVCSELTSVTIENPNCEIGDMAYTICNEMDENNNPYFNGTIYGYEGSTAQAYAEKYDYKFEPLDSAPETSETESESTAEEIKPDDSSGDGKVDILDVITINKAAMGKETLPPEQLKAIDFNQNGKPDSEESLTLLKYIVGLIDDLSA